MYLSSSEIVSAPLLLLEGMDSHWLRLRLDHLFVGILNTSPGEFHLPVDHVHNPLAVRFLSIAANGALGASAAIFRVTFSVLMRWATDLKLNPSVISMYCDLRPEGSVGCSDRRTR